MEVVLIIELSDLGLMIANHGGILVPLLASEFLEELHLVLAVSRCGQFLSLSEVEGECEELLSVGGVEAKLVDVLLVLVKRGVSGSEELFVRAKVLLRSFNLVYKGLKLDGVSVGSFKLGLVAERDVFKTVDLTETPDEGIEISSTALDSENFLQIGVLSDSLHHLIEEFRLGKWVSGVGSEVVSVFILLRLVRAILLTLVEETEAAH